MIDEEREEQEGAKAAQALLLLQQQQQQQHAANIAAALAAAAPKHPHQSQLHTETVEVEEGNKSSWIIIAPCHFFVFVSSYVCIS